MKASDSDLNISLQGVAGMLRNLSDGAESRAIVSAQNGRYLSVLSPQRPPQGCPVQLRLPGILILGETVKAEVAGATTSIVICAEQLVRENDRADAAWWHEDPATAMAEAPRESADAAHQGR